MINKILTALKENRIQTYQINENTEESVELFFIRKNLDMRREKKVHHCQVTVYREFEKDGQRMLGSSVVSIENGMTDGEIGKKLADAYFAASFVCNPYYELYEGTEEAAPAGHSSLEQGTAAGNAAVMAKAIFAEDSQEDVFLNTVELFAQRSHVHVLNSRGVDVSFTKDQVYGEFVAQCIRPQNVETYRDFSYDQLDTEAMEAKVKEAFEMTKARANASFAPKAGNYRVILSGGQVRELLDFYITRSSAAAIYPKYSTYHIGMKVQGDKVMGDRLNMTLKAKEPYSSEGIVMKDRPLLVDGELKTIHGNSRFSYYLGMEPTGSYTAVSMPAGHQTLAELKQGDGPCLHVVNFSSFEMNPFTGRFGGEIRLAFLIEGEKVTPVTGGSINGSILELQDNLAFSKEMQTEQGFEGPFAVCLYGVSVAGC